MRIGRYEIIDELGAGGMGKVRLARAPSGRLVVLKTALGRDKDDDERLRDEARVGLRLRHPGIVETVELFEHEGRAVLVTAFVPGATLYELRQGGPMPGAVVCRIGRQVADALDAIHNATDEGGRRLEILHRDVTAGNVMLGHDGNARLIDLGIARSVETRAMRTETGMLRGTLRYLAPELFAGESYTGASDLWALGVVLWEALLGRPAIRGSDAEAIGKICSGNVMQLDASEQPDPRVQKAIGQLLKKSVPDRLRRAREGAALFSMVEKQIGGDVTGTAQDFVFRVAGGGSLVDGGAASRAAPACAGSQTPSPPSPSPPSQSPRLQPPLAPLTATSSAFFELPSTHHDRPATAALAPLPARPVDEPFAVRRTPSADLLDYAALLQSMEAALERAWDEQERRRQDLSCLPLVRGIAEPMATDTRLDDRPAYMPASVPAPASLFPASMAAPPVAPRPGWISVPAQAHVRAAPAPEPESFFPDLLPLPPHTPLVVPDPIARARPPMLPQPAMASRETAAWSMPRRETPQTLAPVARALQAPAFFPPPDDVEAPRAKGLFPMRYAPSIRQRRAALVGIGVVVGVLLALAGARLWSRAAAEPVSAQSAAAAPPPSPAGAAPR